MKIARNILMVLGFTMFALLPVSPVVSIANADRRAGSLVITSDQDPQRQSELPSGNTLLCQIFPFINNITLFNVNTICSGSGPQRSTVITNIVQLVQLGVSFIFIGIVITAVFVVVKAAVKYIRSEGDDAKIEEAQKAIKSAFVGIIALFVGIIGLILILVLFNATDALNNQQQINSVGDLFGV